MTITLFDVTSELTLPSIWNIIASTHRGPRGEKSSNMADTRKEEEIRRLMQAGMDTDERPSRALSAVSRARRQVGQRDTLAFALVRVWSVLARLLAPVFTFFGEKQAQTVYQQSAGKIKKSVGAGDGKAEDQEKNKE